MHLLHRVCQHFSQSGIDKRGLGISINGPHTFLRKFNQLSILLLALAQRHLGLSAFSHVDPGADDILDQPNTIDEGRLSVYLDSGGALLLSSQDYLYDMNVITTFMWQYLGIKSGWNDLGDGPLTGIVGDEISGGFLNPAYSPAAVGMLEYGDEWIAEPGAIETFHNTGANSGIGVLRFEGPSWRTMVFGCTHGCHPHTLHNRSGWLCHYGRW